MGAWIEIQILCFQYAPVIVAPLVGAWIEIQIANSIDFTYTLVAPLVGAWIEIYLLSTLRALYRCRSPRGSVD